MNSPAVVEVPAVSVATALSVHPSAGKHRGVVGRCARLLADGTRIQGVGTFAHQSVKRWRTRLPELLDGAWVEAVDGDRDDAVNGIICRLICRGGGRTGLLGRRGS